MCSEVANSDLPRRVIVVGAGITGLCTGLALARAGREVTIVERDPPPPDGGPDEAFFGWNRRGAAQFRHPHAFLAVMSNLLEDSFPDLIDEFFEAGARKVTFEDMLPDELKQSYVPAPGDERMWLLMCRRATMETVFRRYAERQHNVEIQSGVNVIGVRTAPEGDLIRVEGIDVQRRGEAPFGMAADLVVDAGGRNSKLKRWLMDLGASIATEDDDAEIVYYTRHYRLLPGVDEPARDPGNPSTGDLGYVRYGVFPGEGGHFAVIVCIHDAEQALHQAVRHGEIFDAMCRSIPGLNRWVSEQRAVATTESFGFSDIHAVWHHYVVDGKPTALNYFAVGDAAVRTNPLYGRGCSTGIMHAHILVDVIEAFESPLQRALEFDRRTEQELRPIFKASLDDDRKAIIRAKAVMAGEQPARPKSIRARLTGAFSGALRIASRRHIRVFRGALRTFNLLEKPGEFMKDRVVLLLTLRYLLRGAGAGAASRTVNGPGREEMLSIIEKALDRSRVEHENQQ